MRRKRNGSRQRTAHKIGHKNSAITVDNSRANKV